MTDLLDKEFEYYISNQESLVRQYNNKFIVIKNQQVIGSYNNEIEAVEKTLAQGHAMETFLVQYCIPGNESYTSVFHSRVKAA
jgi:hypothetical protein